MVQLTSLEANSYRNVASNISFIIWVTQQSANFLQVSSRKIENLASGGVGRFFRRNKLGDAYSGPKRMAVVRILLPINRHSSKAIFFSRNNGIIFTYMLYVEYQISSDRPVFKEFRIFLKVSVFSKVILETATSLL